MTEESGDLAMEDATEESEDLAIEEGTEGEDEPEGESGRRADAGGRTSRQMRFRASSGRGNPLREMTR